MEFKVSVTHDGQRACMLDVLRHGERFFASHDSMELYEAVSSEFLNKIEILMECGETSGIIKTPFGAYEWEICKTAESAANVKKEPSYSEGHKCIKNAHSGRVRAK